VIRGEALRLQKEVEDWERTVQGLRRRVYYLNFFTLKQVRRIYGFCMRYRVIGCALPVDGDTMVDARCVCAVPSRVESCKRGGAADQPLQPE
jgi:hypothetical protein